MGVVYDDWRHVPKALKDDLWDILMLDFSIGSMQKDNVTSQFAEQWRTWKKKLREKYFIGRETKQQILELNLKESQSRWLNGMCSLNASQH